jgi:hypothetical protein
LDVHLILENYVTHTRPRSFSAGWPSVPRYQLHFTPTGVSWLNLVERWFALLTRKQLRRGAHSTTRALEAAIPEDIALPNERPNPFIWTKTADEILANVERFCRRISD